MGDAGYGHEDIPCMTYDIDIDIFTWMCIGWFDHCMSTYSILSLLGFAHPIVGPPFKYRSGVGG